MADDHLPTASLRMLKERAKLLSRLRSFFDSRDFLEVQTPILSRDTVIDLHLDPLSVTLYPDPQNPTVGPTFYLQTSPEFCMKRLLCGGMQQIYQITQAFRAAEVGSLHNPEFTMLEWYRVGDDYAQGMQLLDDLAAALFGLPCERMTYQQAFQTFAGIDPFSAEGLSLGEAKLDEILALQVQPNLGFSSSGKPQPVIVHDYPADQAALAQVQPAQGNYPAVAQRFELFAAGVELANGYHELLDAGVLLQRHEKNNVTRQAAGKVLLPVGSRLHTAMLQGMPACAGTALGVDRLLMVLQGQTEIANVIAFPVERA